MSRFTPAFLDELRQRTTLSTLVGRSVKLTRAGREWKACCPFHHEKSPSFYVNDDKGFYHCFGCSAHGDAIRWLTDQRGLPFTDAVKELADAAGLDLPAPDPRAAERSAQASKQHDVMAAAAEWFAQQLQGDVGAGARAYLERRGVKPATVEAFGLGYAPDRRDGIKSALATFGDAELIEAGLLISVEEKTPYDRFRGRLMIPIRDPRGRVIAFGGRILGAGEPKYLNSPDTPLFDKGRTLYNLDLAAPAARKAGRLIVVEGYLDVIALAQAGIAEAVAPLGTALTEAQLERLWRVVDVPVLCFDGDSAGQKAAVRAAERALPMLEPGRSLSVALLPKGQDPDDLVRSQGVEAFQSLLESALPLNEFIWRAKLAESRLGTPEERSLFGKMLRDFASKIVDEDLRLRYLGTFNRKLSEMFATDRREGDARFEKFRKRGQLRPPEMQRIAKHGIDKAAMAPCVVKGLQRYPQLVQEFAEVLVHFALLLLDRQYRLVAEAMLRATLVDGALEPERLRSILKEEGLTPAVDWIQRQKSPRFSFLKTGVDREKACRDLRSVLEKLSAAPEIQAAIDDATRRLTMKVGDENEVYEDQQFARRALDALNAELLALEQTDDDEFELVGN